MYHENTKPLSLEDKAVIPTGEPEMGYSQTHIEINL